MTGKWGAAAVLVVGLMPDTVAAECVSIAGSMLKQMRAADYVFDGTVTRIDHVAPDGTRTKVDQGGYLGALAQPEDRYLREYAATMQVHRVWKGTVPTEIPVYFVPNVDGPFFTQGKRYVVFARRQSDEMRRSIIDPASPRREPWGMPCSSAPGWDDEKALKQLGPWHRPSGPEADEGVRGAMASGAVSPRRPATWQSVPESSRCHPSRSLSSTVP
jgi:hypothetical protein